MSSQKDTQQTPLLATSVRMDILIGSLVLVAFSILLPVRFSLTPVAGLMPYVLMLTVVLIACALVFVPFISRDKYEFFETYFRITRRGKPASDFHYSDIRAVGRKTLFTFGITLKGEDRPRFIPLPFRSTGVAGVALYDWLASRVTTTESN